MLRRLNTVFISGFFIFKKNPKKNKKNRKKNRQRNADLNSRYHFEQTELKIDRINTGCDVRLYSTTVELRSIRHRESSENVLMKPWSTTISNHEKIPKMKNSRFQIYHFLKKKKSPWLVVEQRRYDPGNVGSFSAKYFRMCSRYPSSRYHRTDHCINFARMTVQHFNCQIELIFPEFSLIIPIFFHLEHVHPILSTVCHLYSIENPKMDRTRDRGSCLKLITVHAWIGIWFLEQTRGGRSSDLKRWESSRCFDYLVSHLDYLDYLRLSGLGFRNNYLCLSVF